MPSRLFRVRVRCGAFAHRKSAAPATYHAGVSTLRQRSLAVLLAVDPWRKAALARELDHFDGVGADEPLVEPPGIPGRPARPEMVGHTAIKQRSLKSPEGLAALMHALAHIEFNAINLAADLTWRFAGMPEAFYLDWMKVAREEAYHFGLLRRPPGRARLRVRRFSRRHDALWTMAEKTKHDMLARLALVPRTLEARGLDASPAIRNKLVSVGDKRGAEILDIILRRRDRPRRGRQPLVRRAVCRAGARAPSPPTRRWPRRMGRRACAGRSTSRPGARPAFSEEELLRLGLIVPHLGRSTFLGNARERRGGSGDP